MSDPITFSCAVYSIRTLADGGLRVALDLSEGYIDAVTWLMQRKRNGETLRIACAIDKQEITNSVQERQERKSKWSATEEPGAR